MNIDYNVYTYDYNLRDGSLDVEAKGKVKSKKYFPFFYEDGKKMIFKPLSKTKPLLTPYFAYSELIWSHLLNAFFDKNIPVYHLAKCNGYEENEPKYHTYGIIVESINQDHERLVNLYEYFMKYFDEHVTNEIKEYINYCLVYYDYTFFFQSELFKNNKDIAAEVSRQILYSILRGDQNFHYENISFIYEGNTLKRVAPPIDHEFSSMFLYLDDEISHLNIQGKQIRELLNDQGKNMKQTIRIFIESLDEETKQKFLSSKSMRNIDTIVSVCPEIVESFLSSLNGMINYLISNPIFLENHDYLEPFSSSQYEVGIARYKDNNEVLAKELESNLELSNIGVEEVNHYLNQEIIDNADLLKKTLENKLSML